MSARFAALLMGKRPVAGEGEETPAAEPEGAAVDTAPAVEPAPALSFVSSGTADEVPVEEKKPRSLFKRRPKAEKVAEDTAAEEVPVEESAQEEGESGLNVVTDDTLEQEVKGSAGWPAQVQNAFAGHSGGLYQRPP